MTIEPLPWRPTHIEMPRGSRVVIVYGPTLVGIDGTHIAFAWHDGTRWHDVRGPSFDGDWLERVTDWAELPTGAN